MTDLTAAVEVGRPQRLTPLVRRITCPNPGPMTGPGTNTYLVGDDDVIVIDPGPDHAEHIGRVAEAGGGRIRDIVVTHTHPDHSPGVGRLVALTGARVAAFDDRDGLVADAHLADGDSLGVGFELVARHTPGHASNHLCFELVDEGMLFSGDHIMAGSTVVITPPDGDMGDYLRSLDRLRSLPLRAIAPAHGHVLTEPVAVIDWYIEHRLSREASIADAVAEIGPATVDEVVAAVYTDVDPSLHPVARYSVLAHLLKLASDGRISGGPGFDEPWKIRNGG